MILIVFITYFFTNDLLVTHLLWVTYIKFELHLAPKFDKMILHDSSLISKNKLSYTAC